MNLLKTLLLPALLLLTTVPGEATAAQSKPLYATFHTSEGDITVRLFPEDAPKTVENFVALATGKKEWTDPKTHKPVKKPLYNGTIFHRVIPGFMIQGGDPEGTGMGSPGYTFEDEFKGNRKFDKPGILAMANRGPNTNGSQFFITVAPTPHLNGRHTIFGEVVSGQDVAVKISEVPKGAMDKPNTPVVITSIDISNKPPKGQAAPKAEKKSADKKKSARTQPDQNQ